MPVPFAASTALPEEVVAACGETPGALCELVLRVTGNPDVARVADLALARPAKVLVVLVLAWAVNGLLRRVIRNVVAQVASEGVVRKLVAVRARAFEEDVSGPAARRRVQRAETIGAVLRSMATLVVWGIAFAVVLSELGVDLAPLIAGAGIAGVALGFGAQNLVRDFLSGLFMLAEDQYGVGDAIDVDGVTGVVEAVGLRTTRLRSVDGTLWHVPNGEIRRVGNMSQQWSRALLDIDVSYGSDLERALEVVESTAAGLHDDPEWNDKFLAEPEVWGVEALGPNGATIRCVIRTVPLEQWTVARELRRRLKPAFDAAGIEIPVGHRAVWIRHVGADAGADGGL